MADQSDAASVSPHVSAVLHQRLKRCAPATAKRGEGYPPSIGMQMLAEHCLLYPTRAKKNHLKCTYLSLFSL